jgi:hypothetical protein
MEPSILLFCSFRRHHSEAKALLESVYTGGSIGSMCAPSCLASCLYQKLKPESGEIIFYFMPGLNTQLSTSGLF